MLKYFSEHNLVFLFLMMYLYLAHIEPQKSLTQRFLVRDSMNNTLRSDLFSPVRVIIHFLNNAPKLQASHIKLHNTSE